MSFTFREENICIAPNQYCLQLNGREKMETKDSRFPFHHTTYNEFNFEDGQDLCHRYSFSSMAQLLRLIYNSGDYSLIEPLISTLFPYDDYDDRQNANNVYQSIIFPATTTDMRVMFFNELLYMLNNSLLNLRPGKSSWNRSIGMCYDPVAWEFTDGKFVITDEIDVFILSNLLRINVCTSTIYFYSAKNSAGEPVLYSSNNSSENQGIGKYDKCDIPIYIYPTDKNGNTFEMRIT